MKTTNPTVRIVLCLAVVCGGSLTLSVREAVARDVKTHSAEDLRVLEELTGRPPKEFTFKEIDGLKTPVTLDLHQEVSDQFLREVRRFPEIREIRLWSNRTITATGFETLVELPKLESLDLTYSRVDDAALQAIGKCKSLQKIRLSNTKITEKGVQHLVNLPNLLSITMEDTGVVDLRDSQIDKITTLKVLSVSSKQLKAESMAPIVKLTNLTSLTFGPTTLKDEDLREVSQLTKLRQFVLLKYYDDLTDETLRMLANLPELEFVSVSSNKFTKPAAEELRSAPKLRRFEVYGAKLPYTAPIRLRR